MNTAKNFLTAMHTNMMFLNAGVKPERRAKKEGGSHLVEYLGLIIVAVAILFIFKDQLNTIFTNITKSVETKLNAIFPT